MSEFEFKLDREDESNAVRNGVMLTLFGEAGSGKTTCATQFDNPYIVCAGEKGVYDKKIPRTNLLTSYEEFTGVLSKIKNAHKQNPVDGDRGVILSDKDGNKYHMKTLVIDTIGGVELLLNADVCKQKGVKSLTEKKDYGANVNLASDKFDILIRYIYEVMVLECKVDVIFLAHAKTKKISPPDGEPYDGYELSMSSKKPVKSVVNNSDALIMLRDKVIVDDETGKASRRVKEVLTKSLPSIELKSRFFVNDIIIEVPVYKNNRVEHLQACRDSWKPLTLDIYDAVNFLNQQ